MCLYLCVYIDQSMRDIRDISMSVSDQLLKVYMHMAGGNDRYILIYMHTYICIY
jgi:hypothetical protein